MELQVTGEQLEAMGLDPVIAEFLVAKINPILADHLVEDCWPALTREVLDPQVPFAVHLFLFRLLESHWDRQHGLMPAWIPSLALQHGSNIAMTIHHLELDSYESFHRWSVKNREAFWSLAVEKTGIVFKKSASLIADGSKNPSQPQWFPDASLNIADSCFQADGESIAIRYRKNGQGPLMEMTYDALDRMSNRVANSLQSLGLDPGDAVGIDMPMTSESVVIYLGIVKAGCRVISIADSFSPPEIATRLDLGKAKAVFTTQFLHRGGKALPMYQKVLQADAPLVVVLPSKDDPPATLRDGDLLWNDFLKEEETFESLPCQPQDWVNILFSSGTTGDPKAIPWDHTTPIKCAVDGFFHQDIQPHDVLCWPTNLGWMMGPWVIYAAMVNKSTLALFEDAPTGADFCRFVQDAQVTVLGVVPSLVKAWKNSDAVEGLDWSHIKAFSSTGECSNGEEMLWLMSRAGYKPVIEYCGGTEIGGGYLTSTLVQSNAPAAFNTPALGLDMVLLDENSQPAEEGEVFLVPPSIGLSSQLINRDHHQVYYQGTPSDPSGCSLRRHGDQIKRLPGGYFRAQGRADDTMNLGGIKVSSAEIERALKNLPEVTDVAAIAMSPPDGGPSLLVLCVVAAGAASAEIIQKRCQTEIRERLNPLFKVYRVKLLKVLPRTASGKIIRRELRDQFNEADEPEPQR